MADPILFFILAFCAIVGVITLVHHFAKNRRVPAEAWLMILGVGYGMAHRMGFPSLPVIKLSPDFIFLVALPLLIFSSGRKIKLSQLRSEWVSVSFFSVIGIVISTFLIGVPMAYMLEIPLIHGLLFGAALSATDPGVVGAILKRFALPEALFTRIEGESLFNDATTVVLFGVFFNVVFYGLGFDFESISLDLLWKVGVALPIGCVAGYVAGKFISALSPRSAQLDISMAVILAFVAYLVAETTLHASGIIAVLFAAIFYARIRSQVTTDSSPVVEVQDKFWDYLILLLNGFLFLSLGVATGLHDFPIDWTVPGAILIILFAQPVHVYLGAFLLRLVGQKFPWDWQNIMSLAGLRGAISVALILTLPKDYAYHTPFLCAALLMCLFPLLIQPVLLQKYLSKRGKE